MPRRSVTLPPDLEREVRRLQARLLTTMDRDISFNETLNLALAAAFAVPDLVSEIDQKQWATLLTGSDWQTNGTISEAARQVLECIVPPSTAKPRREKAARKRPRRRAAVQATTPKAANPTPDAVVREPVTPESAPEPVAEPMPEPTMDEATPTPVAEAASGPIHAEAAREATVSASAAGAEPPLVSAFEDKAITFSTESTAPLEPDESSSEPAVESTVAPRASIPLPDSFANPIGPEAMNEELVAEQEPVDAPEPESRVETVLGSEVQPTEEPEPEPEPERMAEIEEPPAASRPAFGGGMDLEALRQAIVGGETEVPDAMRDDAGRSRFGAPLDANDFAARMSGFVPGEPIGEEDAASTVEIIVPEVTLPSSEPHAAREATKMEEPAPVISDVDEATADDEADERSAPPPEAEEPTAPPPSDQATDYLDLDRALKDAAAAYEERLRNSGAT